MIRGGTYVSQIAGKNLVLSMPRPYGIVNSASQADFNAYEEENYLSGILSMFTFDRCITQVPEIHLSMS